MKMLAWFGRCSTRPLALWSVYVLVLFGVAIGLVALSRHALELNRQQWLAGQRETLEQNVRVALWRLDSRLAPYLATLHDAAATNRLNVTAGIADDFVLQRFIVVQMLGKTGKPEYQYIDPVVKGFSQPMGTETMEQAEEKENQLAQQIPVEQLASMVKELLPEGMDAAVPQTDAFPNNALVQSYSLAGGPQAQQQRRELDNRAVAVQQQLVTMNQYGVDFQPIEIRLSPFWIRDQLMLVRTRSDAAQTFEGAWLDWVALEESLKDDISDLLPDATFRSIERSETPDPTRALAALPVAIVPQATQGTNPPWSATHTALLLSWLGLAAAALVAALALSRLISLSERRASFVSAVTHELRTPLTTFRLYSDLLARDMVTNPEDRKEYLQTLRREADRLSHLIDNVLRYSRLERANSGPAMESVQLSQWIDRITPRLEERLRSAEMELVIDQQGDGTWATDPAALEQLVFNLIDNAAKYAKDASDRRVHLDAMIDNEQVVISVTDHGSGVPRELQATIFKPFAKSAERAAETAAGVGLGLALARQTAAALGGSLTYGQADGNGASFKLTLRRR